MNPLEQPPKDVCVICGARHLNPDGPCPLPDMIERDQDGWGREIDPLGAMKGCRSAAIIMIVALAGLLTLLTYVALTIALSPHPLLSPTQETANASGT